MKAETRKDIENVEAYPCPFLTPSPLQRAHALWIPPAVGMPTPLALDWTAFGWLPNTEAMPREIQISVGARANTFDNHAKLKCRHD